MRILFCKTSSMKYYKGSMQALIHCAAPAFAGGVLADLPLIQNVL